MLLDLRENILPVYKPAFHNEDRFLVFKGGAGSGKSVFAAQKVIARCLTEPGHRFLVLRKVDKSIRDSCFLLCKDLIEQWGLTDHCTVHKAEMRITIPSLGGGVSEILFKGLDDREKIKSIQGITGIWFEEATEFDKDDLTQLNLRLRGETPFYKQIIITFNPIDETHWLKAYFYDDSPSSCTRVHSTYLDNTYCDEEYIAELLDLAETDENYYRIYCLGEWGVIKTGQEFFHLFQRNVHVKPNAYDPDKWVVIARDFNNLPYMTALLCQVEGRKIRVFGEECNAPPLNTIEDSVDRIADRIPESGAVIETGDPSGKAKVARKTRKEAKNYYEQVKSSWQQHGVAVYDRVPRSAPSLASRKMAWGKVLNGWGGFELVIDPSCKNVIKDFESLQQDVTGGWVKKKVKNKDTGATYEEGGHCADALTYLLFAHFPFLFKKKNSSSGFAS